VFVSNGSLVTKTPLLAGSPTYFPKMSTAGLIYPTAYSQMYRGQLWVTILVNKLAKAHARLPFPVYERDELNRPKADGHPMARLLARPNPAMSAHSLWIWTSSTRNTFGEAFWFKSRDRRGNVVALFPLHPSGMSSEGGWTFDNGTLTLRDIPREDLVIFKGYNPDSLTRGMSPLEPLRATLENEWAARAATSSFWERGARPGLFLKHPKNLSEPAQQRLRAQVDSMHAGAARTGGTMILEEGLEPHPATLTAEEAQYIETRKLNREEVCAAFDVPPPVVHILDRATFSNITEQMRSMYRDTMGGILPEYEAAVETDLRAVDWPDDAVYAEFLMDEVLRGAFEARQDALAKATHMTIAEKRKMENLPFIEGTDRIFLNTATMPLDAIDSLVAQQVQGSASESAPVALLSVGDVRAVMGRLGWQSSLDQVDPAQLCDGLPSASVAAVTEALALANDTTHLKALIKARSQA